MPEARLQTLLVCLEVRFVRHLVNGFGWAEKRWISRIDAGLRAGCMW